MTEAWSAPTSWDVVCRRASGRRHYNFTRQVRAFLRQVELARLLRVRGSLTERGTQARLARELGVSRATICRDVKALLKEGQHCPQCGAFTRPRAAEFP